jgi:hypothetical protein
MTLREQVEQYRCRMDEFNQWERRQPPIERAPAAILADLGFLLSRVSPERRLADPDPQKLGIRQMRAILARVGSLK